MQAISLNQLRFINSTIWLPIFVNISGCNVSLDILGGNATLTGFSFLFYLFIYFFFWYAKNRWYFEGSKIKVGSETARLTVSLQCTAKCCFR